MKKIRSVFFIFILLSLCVFSFAGCAKNGEKLFPVDESFINNYLGSIEITHLPYSENKQILIADKSEIRMWINEFNTVPLAFYPQKWNTQKLQFETSIELPAKENIILTVKLLNPEGYGISVDGGLKANSFSVYDTGMVQKSNSVRTYHTGTMSESTINKLLELF